MNIKRGVAGRAAPVFIHSGKLFHVEQSGYEQKLKSVKIENVPRGTLALLY
jgi:hypothetical protein